MNWVSSKQTTSTKQHEADTKLVQAHRRIDEMEFNEAEEAFIWADWPNMDEHIAWLLTATRADIKAWIDANY